MTHKSSLLLHVLVHVPEPQQDRQAWLIHHEFSWLRTVMSAMYTT